jgi:hypothetical protein
MPPVQVQAQRQLRRRPLALPLDKTRLDPGPQARPIAVPAIEDAAFAVDQDRLAQPVVLDVGRQLLEGRAAQQRKQPGDGMKLAPRRFAPRLGPAWILCHGEKTPLCLYCTERVQRPARAGSPARALSSTWRRTCDLEFSFKLL